MENKKKVFISIGLIVVLAIVLINYIISCKSNEETDIRDLLIEENNEQKTNEVEEIVNNEEETIEIVVHITGEVKKVGILYLPEGARLVDAIEKAGGETKNADLSQVNLAYKLQDGEKIYIPNKKEKINEYISIVNGNNGNKEDNSSNNSKGENIKVNLNTATQGELDSLPGIGPSIAQKIIDYREKNGKFNKIEELQNVKGIGESKYSEIKDKITV